MKLLFYSRIMSLSAIQRQSVLSLLFTTIITLVGFFSTMFFSHVLGKDLMGVYYLFVAYYSLFNMIGDGGFGQAAVKCISEGKEQNAYLTAYACIRGVLTIVSTLLLLTLWPFLVDLKEYELISWIVLALISALGAQTINRGVMGLGHVGVYNVGVGLADVFRIIFQVGAVIFGFSVYGLIGGYIAGIIISGVLCLKYFRFKPAKFGICHLKKLVSFGLWVFLISTGSIVFTYTDTIFIGYFMTNGDVGVYRTALQFAGVSVLLLSAINSTLPPKISKWSADNQFGEIARPVSRGITISMILAIPVFVGGVLLADKLLYYFYGAEFAAGAVACCILLAVQIVSVFTVLLGTALTSSDHARQSFYATATASALNIILNCILIPVLGINGAALATLISYSVNTLLIVHFLRRYISINIEKRPIINIFIASVVMGIFILFYKQLIPLDNVILTLIPVCIGAVIYFFLLFKIDSGIRNEIAGMVTTLGLPWPKWL